MSDTTPTDGPTPEPAPEPTPAASQPQHGASPGATPAASRPAGSMPTGDQAMATLKSADRLDLGIIGAGLLAFIGSLLPYYTVSVEVFGTSAGGSSNAWHGFFGWFGALAALVGAGLLVVRLLGIAVSIPVPVRTAVLGLFGLALVCTVIALFLLPGGGCDDMGIDGACDAVNEGRGFGYWLALLATIAGTALAAMRRSAD